MNKRVSLLLLIFSILICGADYDKVCANENDKVTPEILVEIANSID